MVLVMQVDMVEIYNEELRDLLAPINGKQRKQQSLQIKVRKRAISRAVFKKACTCYVSHAFFGLLFQCAELCKQLQITV